MPLQKIVLASGVNRENTRFASEGKWFESDKIRFRQGTPEQIGGWTRISANTYLGVCRSLFDWVTLASIAYIGVGTNLKFYVAREGAFFDITPIRSVVTLGADPFTTTITSTAVTVAATAHGAIVGDFVTFSGATAVGGLTLNGEYQITLSTDANSFQIAAATPATSSATGGGAVVVATYQINTGPAVQIPSYGWGAGYWGSSVWGNAAAASDFEIRLWSQSNYGENLLFAPRYGAIYYWKPAIFVDPPVRAVAVSSMGGIVTFTVASPTQMTLTNALSIGTSFTLTSTGTLPTGLSSATTYYIETLAGNVATIVTVPGGTEVNVTGAGSGVNSIAVLLDVPLYQHKLMVSDVSRFVLAFGCNEIGSTTIDPMLIRWSDQENVLDWFPQITNQAGSLRLSHGSEIYSTLQVRQEILVWTDTALYSMQYLGAPLVWGATLMDGNISATHPNSVVLASGVVYWMGLEKFYMYDGRVQTLSCDLRQYVFSDINFEQEYQVFGTTNEAFNEVWWFYCSADSTVVDRYVIYNYLEKVWYYGNMGRTAWIDAGLSNVPIAATYSQNLVYHETGVVDGEGPVDLPIHSLIISSQFDLQDGHNVAFVWRMLPDLTFQGSAPSASPQVTMSLLPLQNSGSGYTVPPSVGGSNSYPVVRIGSYDVDQFTGQINTRIRARQMSMKIECNTIGTQWQLGYPRIDIRQDGRKF
jgi:hypothetical protein